MWDCATRNTRLRSDLQAARIELGATHCPQRQNRDLSRMLEFRADQPVDLGPASDRSPTRYLPTRS